MLIGDRWTDALCGKTIPVMDPATGERLCTVPAGKSADVDAAVSAAQVALEGSDWKRMRPADRERLLFRLADAVEADQGHPAELDSWTMAKL